MGKLTLNNEQITIFYESWQMDCCGIPFAIGDNVEWFCDKSELSNNSLIDCDYYYEAHSDDSEFCVMGKVIEIYKVDFEYKSGEGNIFIPIAYTKEPIDKASEFVAESGFLVTLNNATIKQTK